MKWRVSFRLDAADDETGVAIKDLTVVPVDSDPDPAIR